MGGVGHTSPLIWPCSDWGLPCHRCYQRRGGLLPHRFTLTRTVLRPHGRFLFCGPFRRLSAPRRYLAVYPVELGLSSGTLRHPRSSRLTSGLKILRERETVNGEPEVVRCNQPQTRSLRS